MSLVCWHCHNAHDGKKTKMRMGMMNGHSQVLMQLATSTELFADCWACLVWLLRSVEEGTTMLNLIDHFFS